jgi:ATP-binding cassette subfamily A (ABC1) protein 3
MVAFTYIIGCLVKREGTGQVLVILINLVLGAIGGTAVFIMRMYKQLIDKAIPLAKFFRIIPSFCFCFGYNLLVDRYYIFAADFEKEMDGIISWGTAYLVVLKTKKSKDVLSLKYLGSDFIYLGVETVVYILILVFIENFDKIFARCFTSKFKPKNENNKIKEEIRENNHANRNKKNQRSYNIDINQENNKGDTETSDSKISIPDNVNDTYVKNEIIKAKRPSESNFAIKIINLIKDYYGGPFGFKIFNSCFRTTKAVRDISLCLNYGECFGFLGVNGAGKTTTFKCLSKEILPTYGKIYIDNKEINEEFDKVRSLIGYCPQFDAIFESLTVYENLEFYGLIKGAKKDKIKSIVNALMEEMNLIVFKDKVSGSLSGGNKRKLSVAIALICNPPIILLDEPSTGMDPEARRFMWGVIHRLSLNQKKSTIIMTTHSMEEAETLCKRIGIMVDGQFKCLSTSDEIKEKYGYGFEVNIQINNPNLNQLYEKYNISEEEKNIQINMGNIEAYLQKLNLEKYTSQLNKQLLGGKIIEEIEACGYVYLPRIISWVYYIENALNMINIILKYFPEIHCIDYGENNMVFKIKRNKDEGEKSIGFLFGIIEENKIKFNIEQYFLQLTSLEQIFNIFAKESEKPIEENINNTRNTDISITHELISSIID